MAFSFDLATGVVPFSLYYPELDFTKMVVQVRLIDHQGIGMRRLAQMDYFRGDDPLGTPLRHPISLFTQRFDASPLLRGI